MGTKNNPGKFDCYGAAAPDEPMFILLGRDPLAPQLVAIWAAVAKLVGTKNPEKIAEALQCSNDMRAYLAKHHQQEFPVLDAIERSLMLPDEDATPDEPTKETH